MTTENPTPTRKSFSFDWLVSGTLTKLGAMFDELTGRNWKPASSLATSEIVERLKVLLDNEAQDLGIKGKFVPHNIKLLMQWDKFSTDASDSLRKLEQELLTAAIDHINDRRFHTYAPLNIEIKTDYFTEGVKLQASFDKFAVDRAAPEVSFNMAAADLKNVVVAAPAEAEPEPEIYRASFTIGDNVRETKLTFLGNSRLSVGRTKENALSIDDPSVSKLHASLVINADGRLLVADTGSTNGTFSGAERIAYGKAFPVGSGEAIKFGSVVVAFEHLTARVVNADDDFPTSQSIDAPVEELTVERKPAGDINSEEKEQVTILRPLETKTDQS